MCTGDFCWHLYYFQAKLRKRSSYGTLHDEPKLTNWRCILFSYLESTEPPKPFNMKNADFIRGGEDDEKIFLSAKQKEGWLVYTERRLSAQVQVDYNLRASIKYVDYNIFHIKCSLIFMEYQPTSVQLFRKMEY